MGQLHEEVYLPDESTLRIAHKTLLPFEQLSKAAWEAAVLPGIKKSLASVNKWAEEVYMTIFHPGDNGIMVHKPGMLTMIFGEPPVLRGYKPCGAKLWMKSTDDAYCATANNVSNIYSLPSKAQAIRYLHAAAGYPVRDTWIAAINAGNYITRPGLTAKSIRHHFPESDETQKGHTKMQCQNVRSKRTKIEKNITLQLTKEKLMQDVYIKYTMQTTRCIATKWADSQQRPAGETNI